MKVYVMWPLGHISYLVLGVNWSRCMSLGLTWVQ